MIAHALLVTFGAPQVIWVCEDSVDLATTTFFCIEVEVTGYHFEPSEAAVS